MQTQVELWTTPSLELGSGILRAPIFKRKKKKGKKFKNKKERLLNYFERRAEKALRRKRRKGKGQTTRLILTPLRDDQYVVLRAPTNFSLIENTEEVIGFFKAAARLFSRRHQVQFDLESVTKLTPDAIALLIAKVKDVNFTRGINVRGNKPKKKELKKIFEDSGFLDHVRAAYVPPKNENNLLIHQVTRKKVDPDTAKRVGELSVKHTFKNDKKFQPIYKIMIESMANTDNHADIKQEGVHDWWLFTYCNPENNVTSYVFLDLGVGIFNSNPVAEFKRQLLTSAENITNLNLTSKGNLQLVPKLFSGEIFTSRKKEKNRGQGLPSIVADMAIKVLGETVV